MNIHNNYQKPQKVLCQILKFKRRLQSISLSGGIQYSSAPIFVNQLYIVNYE